jgi:pimeloyl-ACP methyl ester carboxylesterase
LGFAPGYSYVDAAAAQGYPTFSFDRLGNGRSSHPDPLQIVQLPFQADIVHVLIQRLKSGFIGGISFKTVIGVRHSIGGALTHGHTSKYPDDLDAVILTGHTAYPGGSGIGFAGAAFQIANTFTEKAEWRQLPTGYYTLWPVEQVLQLGSYYSLLWKKQWAPYFLVPKKERTNKDFFYCQGNCLEPTDLTAESLVMYFPNAEKERSGAITVPNLGHNLNRHLGRDEVFRRMLEFVEKVAVNEGALGNRNASWDLTAVDFEVGIHSTVVSLH